MAVTRVDRRTGGLGEDAAGVRGIGKFVIYFRRAAGLVGRQSAGEFYSMRQLRMAGSVTDKRDWRCGRCDWAGEEYNRSR